MCRLFALSADELGWVAVNSEEGTRDGLADYRSEKATRSVVWCGSFTIYLSRPFCCLLPFLLHPEHPKNNLVCEETLGVDTLQDGLKLWNHSVDSPICTIHSILMHFRIISSDSGWSLNFLLKLQSVVMGVWRSGRRRGRMPFCWFITTHWGN